MQYSKNNIAVLLVISANCHRLFYLIRLGDLASESSWELVKMYISESLPVEILDQKIKSKLLVLAFKDFRMRSQLQYDTITITSPVSFSSSLSVIHYRSLSLPVFAISISNAISLCQIKSFLSHFFTYLLVYYLSPPGGGKIPQWQDHSPAFSKILVNFSGKQNAIDKYL